MYTNKLIIYIFLLFVVAALPVVAPQLIAVAWLVVVALFGAVLSATVALPVVVASYGQISNRITSVKSQIKSQIFKNFQNLPPVSDFSLCVVCCEIIVAN
jgi:c-di-AMP phosphodiesterase-like protein